MGSGRRRRRARGEGAAARAAEQRAQHDRSSARRRRAQRQPIACDTPGERASVKLPASALAGSGASADDSVGLVLYAASLNFHGMGEPDGRGDGAGALVSFSLRQGEPELSVKGLPTQ